MLIENCELLFFGNNSWLLQDSVTILGDPTTFGHIGQRVATMFRAQIIRNFGNRAGNIAFLVNILQFEQIFTYFG